MKPVNHYQKKHNIKNQERQSSNLSNVKVVQKNLNIANEKILLNKQFLGQYGYIKRISLSQTVDRDANNFVLYSAHVEYENEIQASLAILCLRKTQIDTLNLKASYGLNKYCRQFVSGKKCTKKKCTFIHQIQDEKFYKQNSNVNFLQLITFIDIKILEKLIRNFSKYKKNQQMKNMMNQTTLFFSKNLLLLQLSNYLQKNNQEHFVQEKTDNINKHYFNNQFQFNQDTNYQKNQYQYQNYLNLSQLQYQHSQRDTMNIKNFKRQNSISYLQFPLQKKNEINLLKKYQMNSLSTIDSFKSFKKFQINSFLQYV